jgi:phosphoribosylformylglycinamidine synthase
MCHSCGITSITRIERSRRYLLTSSNYLNPDEVLSFNALVHDRMTECVYNTPLMTFETLSSPEPVQLVPILAKGKAALEEINKTKVISF